MSHVSDLMDAFNYAPETFKPDEFKTALLAAHQRDEEGWTAAVSAKDNEQAELKNKVTELQSENWKLFTRIGTPIPPDNNGGSQVPPAASADPNEPELKGTSSFFTPVNKE